MKPVVLFDMDGTLTEPRLPVSHDMMLSLQKLSKYATIGIVSGSDFEYIHQQMEFFNYSHEKWFRDILVYPCNGTKRYVNWRQNFSVDMREELGNENLYKLIELLIDWQASYTSEARGRGFSTPLTGLHIQNRGSMINWCPIGRGADQEERKLFQQFDENLNWRDKILTMLKEDFEDSGLDGVTVVKGGSTSFDIYPDGWDKRYVLRFHEQDSVYFVGDKCEEGGNDYELYKKIKDGQEQSSLPDDSKQLSLFAWRKSDEACHKYGYGGAWRTVSPQETIEIIERDIIPSIKTKASS